MRPRTARLLGSLGMVVCIAALVAVGSAHASTVEPGGPGQQASGCSAGGLFGHVAPDGNALVGVQYPDPESGANCVLDDGATIPGDVFVIWLFTPNAVPNGTVGIGVEEYRWGHVTTDSPGPNGTTIVSSVGAPVDVDWSNTSVSASPGEFQQFDLQVPAVYTVPSNAANITLSILGLTLPFYIATPGTAIPVAETLGGLIGWLALMSPAAVLAFVAGFPIGAIVVYRLRYISTGRWAGGFAFLVTFGILVGVGTDFTGFLYWLGSVGVGGLALLLLVPVFFWGAAFWITVRGKRLRARVIRSPLAQTKGNDPVAGVAPVRVFGGGETGHPEELVEGLGIGGPKAALHRMLGLRVRWNARKIAREPRLIRYDWQNGKLDIEGEYAAWPVDGGTKLDVSKREPQVVWFPWRKSVKARLDPLSDPEDAPHPENDGVRDPALWAFRGFFLGGRHGEVTLSALGSPDYAGPDQYIRGVAPAAAFGRESQRRGTALVMMNEEVSALAEEKAHEIVAIQDRLQSFPGSPEAMEGVRELSTHVMRQLFDPDRFLQRLEDRGKARVDYRPPGASKWQTTVTDVRTEALEPLPPDLRGKTLRRGQRPA